MRSNGGLESEFKRSGQWKDQQAPGRIRTLSFEMVDGKREPRVSSFSGHERNKLFLNRDGNEFSDVSLYSGADEIADGRVFNIWDFDRDGAQDLALINMNAPHVQIFQNQLFRRLDSQNQFIAVRLIGGNQSAEASEVWSNRDGIGALLTVVADGKTFVRETRRGEGFSGHNSETKIIGLGNVERVDSISVQWPAGSRQSFKDLECGQLLTIYENVADAPADKEIHVQDYVPADKQNINNEKLGTWRLEQVIGDDDAEFRIFFTMATWCTACKSSLPTIAELKSAFDDQVRFYGFPIDLSDSAESLEKYASDNKLPYQLLKKIPMSKRMQLASFLQKAFGTQVTTCSVITDRQGNPVEVFFGVPTISDVRRVIESFSTSD